MSRNWEVNDLDLAGTRLNEGRAPDIAFTSGGDLTLGAGNFFRVSPSSTGVLRRISGGNWLPGARVRLWAASAFTIVTGAAYGSGFYGISCSFSPVTVLAGGTAVLTFAGDVWVLDAQQASTTTVIGPAPTPGFGSALYTAKVVDPLKRTDVRCLLPWGGETGTLFSSLWEQISGASTWQARGFGGQIYGVDASGSPTIVLQDGDIVASWCPTTVDPPWTDPIHFGLYEVVDCGFHWVPTPEHPETLMGASTKAIIRRTSDTNTSEKMQQGVFTLISGAGVQFAGRFLRLASAPETLDTDPMTFELLT
jgi:hypothetical protein